MEIIKGLENFGLSKKEAAAYAALLKLQKANPHEIAKEADLERTTIYKLLEILVEKGMARKSFEGKRLVFLAEPPYVFKEILGRKENLLKNLLPALLALEGKKQNKPIVSFYEDIRRIRQAVLDTLNCQEKLRRDFASVSNIVEFLGKRFIDHQIEERVKKGIKARSLRCLKGEFNEKDWFLDKSNKELLREARYLPESFHFEPVIFIYDNIITVVSSKKESYALVIESQELSQAMKILFDIAWESAKKI